MSLKKGDKKLGSYLQNIYLCGFECWLEHSPEVLSLEYYSEEGTVAIYSLQAQICHIGENFHTGM